MEVEQPKDNQKEIEEVDESKLSTAVKIDRIFVQIEESLKNEKYEEITKQMVLLYISVAM